MHRNYIRITTALCHLTAVLLNNNINVSNVKVCGTECPNLTCNSLIDHINFIQLWCNDLIIVYRPRQTLTDNTDITHRHIIELTNKMNIHPNRGEHSLYVQYSDMVYKTTT